MMMMIDKIKEVLNPKILLNVENGNIIILENDNKDNNKALKKITLQNCPKDTIAFKMDIFSSISQNLNPSNPTGINKGVDAVVINKDTILFIELKSSKIQQTPIAEKIFSSYSFMKYISLLLKYFYNNTQINNLSVGALVTGLKGNARLPKSKPREFPEYKNTSFVFNNNHKIQILKILKTTGKNYNLNYQNIIKDIRPKNKTFQNWI